MLAMLASAMARTCDVASQRFERGVIVP